MFNHKYRYLFIVALGIYSFFSSLFLETFRYYSIEYSQWLIASVFVLVCLSVWEGNRLTQRVIIDRIIKQTAKFRSLFLSFLVSQVVALVAGVMVYYLIGLFVLQRGTFTRVIELKLVILYSLRVNLFLQCLFGIVFFFKRFQQKQLEAESLKRENMQAQLSAITSQVNPHFLFNNLNVLSTLVMQKNKDANTFIEAFSTVYRYILANRETEIVRLDVELEFIEPYLYLLKTRFDDALRVELSIADKYKEYYVVPVALQLLLENATKHNIVSVKSPLYVRLYINDDEYLVVENNLQEKRQKPNSTHVGLNNINQRCKWMVGKEIIIHNDQKIFSVAIPLLKPGDVKSMPVVN